jgi:hypothetical protein
MATPEVIIADRGEFIDALQRLRKGQILVQPVESDDRCVLDGCMLYTAYRPLASYQLIEEFRNREGFPSARYFRLSERGRAFADRACATWRQRPLLERLAVRLTG